jgi:hypothetical protein
MPRAPWGTRSSRALALEASGRQPDHDIVEIVVRAVLGADQPKLLAPLGAIASQPQRQVGPRLGGGVLARLDLQGPLLVWLGHDVRRGADGRRQGRARTITLGTTSVQARVNRTAAAPAPAGNATGDPSSFSNCVRISNPRPHWGTA